MDKPCGLQHRCPWLLCHTELGENSAERGGGEGEGEGGRERDQWIMDVMGILQKYMQTAQVQHEGVLMAMNDLKAMKPLGVQRPCAWVTSGGCV